MSFVTWVHDKLTARKMNRVFSRKPDPYHYRTSLYEQDRFEKILSVLGRQTFNHTLEVGCGEGVFTHQLLEISQFVTAVDISEICLDRARQNLSQYGDRVKLIHANIREWLEKNQGQLFDFVILSEVLYYLGDLNSKGVLFEQSFKTTLRKIVSIIVPNGHVLLAHGFCNKEELRIRENYTKRLVNMGLKLEKREIAGELQHEKGNLKCLVDLVRKG